jgi:thiol-disulfide isomerase/thioredoxin
MKFLLTLWALFLVPLVNAQNEQSAGTTITPGVPVTISRTLSCELMSNSDLKATVFYYEKENSFPNAYELDVAVLNGEVQVPLSPPLTAKALFVRFYAGEKAEFFSSVLQSSKEIPLKGAFASLASGYSATGRVMELEYDEMLAYQYLKKEFSLYPDSKSEYFTLYAWLAKSISDDEGLAEVKQILLKMLQNSKPSEDDFQKVAYVQTKLGDKQAAKVTNERLRKTYPNGKWAMEEKVNSFYQEEDPIKKEQLFLKLRKEVDKNTLEYMASNLAGSFGLKDRLKFEKYSALIKDRNTLASLYNNIAWKMSGESLDGPAHDLEFGASISFKSLEIVKENFDNLEGKPSYLTNSEWRKNSENSYGLYADTYALIQYKKGNFNDALTYQEYYNKYGYPDGEANLRYVHYLEKVRGIDAALEVMAKCIADGKSNSAMKEKFVASLTSLTPAEAAAKSLSLLEMRLKEKLMTEMVKEMINEEAPAFTLIDLDGNSVSLESLKGKTVVVDFWATWCGPCISSFPGMQAAVDQYSNDENVTFLFINTWEGSAKDKIQETVSKFMEKKGYTFKVLLDIKDTVVASYKVEGIPTKFIIGPDGKIKFKKIGGGDSDKFVYELYAMIELVKNNQN